MFLIIFEDGTLGISENFGDDEIAAVEDSLIDIVDMETGKVMFQNEWVDIDKV